MCGLDFAGSLLFAHNAISIHLVFLPHYTREEIAYHKERVTPTRIVICLWTRKNEREEGGREEGREGREGRGRGETGGERGREGG